MKIFRLLLLSLFIYAVAVLVGCKNLSTAAYQTIGSAETAALAANATYLDLVVTGQIPTNSVPQVERDFNDVQLALHTAASLASGGNSAPIPAETNVKVMNFTNLVQNLKLK